MGEAATHKTADGAVAGVVRASLDVGVRVLVLQPLVRGLEEVLPAEDQVRLIEVAADAAVRVGVARPEAVDVARERAVLDAPVLADAVPPEARVRVDEGGTRQVPNVMGDVPVPDRR